ncbi:MAG: hypothetical protein IK020_05350 [Clostridiales bacterium]|nr:hypothetical protein [Clostridiales bacterium]
MEKTKKKFNSLYIYISLIIHTFWVITFWIWYRIILFRCLPHHSLHESKCILIGLVICTSIIGMTIDVTYKKDGYFPFLNPIIGFGMYASMSYMFLHSRLVIISLITCCIISIASTLLLFIRNHRGRHGTALSTKKRIHLVLIRSKSIGALGFVFIMVFISLPIIFHGYLIKASVSPAKLSDTGVWTLQNQKESLLLLDEDSWKELSITRRLNICQIIANIETQRLGLHHELNVVVSDIKSDAFAYYDESQHMIVIDLECLTYSCAAETCNTVTHESFHAMQKQLVNEYSGNESKEIDTALTTYKHEFENYINPETDKLGYYTQTCEISAREYARLETSMILSQIESSEE